MLLLKWSGVRYFANSTTSKYKEQEFKCPVQIEKAEKKGEGGNHMHLLRSSYGIFFIRKDIIKTV